jgi:hypothetical protein
MPELPADVPGVIDRLRSIQSDLAADDGVRAFNGMYLAVTERVGERLDSAAAFVNPEFIARLDVVFAGFWLEAYDAAAAGRPVPKAWDPLFDNRRRHGVLPVQFALAGMNAHIEHDLPLAVLRTCQQMDMSPHDRGIERDYQDVNAILAEVEEPVRRSFLDDVQLEIDRHIGPVVHLVSAWNIDKARDAAWVTVEALWALRRLRGLTARLTTTLAHTVGMASRCLLTPVVVA